MSGDRWERDQRRLLGEDPEPSSCRWCGVAQLQHLQLWAPARARAQGAGWHVWAAPTQAQIKERMLRRRLQRWLVREISSGRNGKDCPRCSYQEDWLVRVYPWICPGHPSHLVPDGFWYLRTRQRLQRNLGRRATHADDEVLETFKHRLRAGQRGSSLLDDPGTSIQ